MSLKQQIQRKIEDSSSNTILIHSDVMQGFHVPFTGREPFLKKHVLELTSLKDDLAIWMPTFNYAFCKGTMYDVKETPSTVGTLTEYFRRNVASWRTTIPVFNFAGTGQEPVVDLSGMIDPFSTKSAFHCLYEKDALMMHYGSLLLSSTILHYAERISGCLTYRYDKLFVGKVRLENDKVVDVKFNFHVRPLGKHLDYNWPLLENDLVKNKILSIYENENSRILLCRVQELVDFWVEKMRTNRLYLLNSESKAWVEQLLDKLGRPFVITDFETPN